MINAAKANVVSESARMHVVTIPLNAVKHGKTLGFPDDSRSSSWISRAIKGLVWQKKWRPKEGVADVEASLRDSLADLEVRRITFCI